MDCELPTWMSPSTKALCPEFFIPNLRIIELFFSKSFLSRIIELFSESSLSRIIEFSNFVFGPTEQREDNSCFLDFL